jgi:GntR family transcriptional regulator
MKRTTPESIHPFQRLQTMLSDLISTTPPGERLPAEPDLAKDLGVSRATLREAMRTFEGQGLIRRRQGVGTFVVSHSHVIESGLEILQSIETLAREIGLDVAMGDLHVETIEAGSEQAQELGIAIGEPVVRVSRVILAEHRPVAFLIDILPQDVLRSEDLNDDFSGSVLDFLLTRGQPELSHSRAEIQAVAAPSEIARHLQIQRGDVLLLFGAQLVSAMGRVVDYSYSYFLPGYFKFHVVRRVNRKEVEAVVKK